MLDGGWAVKAVLAADVVLEKDWDRWGMLVFTGAGSSEPMVLRKSVGQIQSIRQPR